MKNLVKSASLALAAVALIVACSPKPKPAPPPPAPAPTPTPTVVTLGGLQGLQWYLGNVAQAGWWQAVYTATVDDVPAVADGVELYRRFRPDVFGIEMVESLPVKPKPRNKATAKKSEPSKLATGKAKVPAKKTAQDASKVPVKKPAKVSAKSPVKASAPARAPGGKAPVQAKTKPVKPKGVLKRTT